MFEHRSGLLQTVGCSSTKIKKQKWEKKQAHEITHLPSKLTCSLCWLQGLIYWVEINSLQTERRVNRKKRRRRRKTKVRLQNCSEERTEWGRQISRDSHPPRATHNILCKKPGQVTKGRGGDGDRFNTEIQIKHGVQQGGSNEQRQAEQLPVLVLLLLLLGQMASTRITRRPETITHHKPRGFPRTMTIGGTLLMTATQLYTEHLIEEGLIFFGRGGGFLCEVPAVFASMKKKIKKAN